MKSSIYIILSFTVFIFSFFYCFHNWLEYKFIQADLCGHFDRVIAYKDGQSTWNGKNEIGEDKSCYVEWENNGKKYKSEWWNIGNCNDTAPIEINVVDYTCH